MPQVEPTTALSTADRPGGISPCGRRRILFIGPIPEPITGHSLACQVLLEHLRLDYEVEVIDLNKRDLVNGAASFGRLFKVMGILAAVYRGRQRADLIYLTISESVVGNIKDILIYWLCRRKLSRMVLHLHGGSLRRDIFDRYPRLAHANRRFLRKVGAVIVLGMSHREIFAGMLSRESLHVVPNFAQDFLFRSDAEIIEKFHRPGPLRVLFLSNLITGKGFMELVGACEQLSGAYRAALRMDFAGAFESKDDRRAFLARLSALGEMACYRGIVKGSEKRELLGQAHIFCLPTQLNEGQPISILEAYAAGCVVITTPQGGIPDIFSDRLNGLQVEPQSVASLTAALQRCLERPEILLPIALRNMISARANYRTEIFNERVTAILAGLMNCGKQCEAVPLSEV